MKHALGCSCPGPSSVTRPTRWRGCGRQGQAVASFSILGDMVKEVGGNRVEVMTLVGPNGDAHVFYPTAADAKTLAGADIFFVNGLGFEGWIDRLEQASGFKGILVEASGGIPPLTMKEEEDHAILARRPRVRNEEQTQG